MLRGKERGQDGDLGIPIIRNQGEEEESEQRRLINGQ